ncbi:hypothetical protein DYU11_22675 [Fibrisoma montanum]|uniref:Uncharacterized protein n=1 Tax=Fibrisoma montanum TaxID=2305895 RepID=A0A418M259_9BACT|nr:hypothetical protein [Fibrisoma montanum]RIV19737.1 hypothetical protein DYU11_22675 [Fibrisoma montanum]
MSDSLTPRNWKVGDVCQTPEDDSEPFVVIDAHPSREYMTVVTIRGQTMQVLTSEVMGVKINAFELYIACLEGGVTHLWDFLTND